MAREHVQDFCLETGMLSVTVTYDTWPKTERAVVLDSDLLIGKPSTQDYSGWIYARGGGVLSTKVVIGMCHKHGSQNQAARYINGYPFFRKCGTWMGVPVLIGTSMGHFLSLRYGIDGPFFIIGTSMGRKFSITGTAIVDISFSLSSSRLRKLYKMKSRMY